MRISARLLLPSVVAVLGHPLTYLEERATAFLEQISVTEPSVWIVHPTVDPNPWGYTARFPAIDNAIQRYLRFFASNDGLAGGVVHIVWPYLLVLVGVTSSSNLAAAISAGCGLVAIGLSYFLDPPRPEVSRLQLREEELPMRWWLLAGVSGFSILALEVLYLRLFSLVFHNSTYTFGLVVTVFLFALALGSTLAGVIGVALLQERVNNAVGYALPFSAGVTLYVAASDLIPEVNYKEERNPTVSIVVFGGVALFYLLHRLIEG